MRIPSKLLLAMALLVVSLAPMTQAAPVLIGDATLNTTNDLTVVHSGGVEYEFLDLTATYGMSVQSALSLYAGPSLGFHWANGADMTALFGAFNIAYGHFQGGGFYVPTSLNPLVAVNGLDALSLANHLGTAPGLSAALGWIDEDTSPTNHTYTCIGEKCTPKVFLQQGQQFWPAISVAATFLVRSHDIAPTAAVPLPGALALLGSSLIGLRVTYRRTRNLRAPRS